MAGLRDPIYATENMSEKDKRNLSYIFKKLRDAEDTAGASASTRLTGSVLKTQNYDDIDIAVKASGPSAELYKDFLEILDEGTAVHELDESNAEGMNSRLRFKVNRYYGDGTFAVTEFDINFEDLISAPTET